METKYNLNITTSGENGDNATTSISTTDANKLAELLKLSGMSQSHPIALNVSPEEQYDAPGCDMAEGESWDNEPEATVHSPEEVLKVGDDLHKVKKSYPPVAGGDNPMALESAENKLRGMYDEFIAESEEEVEEAIRIMPRSKADKFDLIMKKRSADKEARAINTEKSKRDTAKAAGYDAIMKGKDPGGIAVEEVHEESADLADIRKLAGI